MHAPCSLCHVLHIPHLSSTDKNNHYVHDDSSAEDPSSAGDADIDVQDPEASSDDKGSASAASDTDSSDAADFRIVKGATQSGKDLLVSTTRYSYTVKVSFSYSAFLWKRHKPIFFGIGLFTMGGSRSL